MKEWKEHIVMNVNKSSLFIGLVASLCAGDAFAQKSAPSLYMVGELMVHSARLGNPAMTASCGLSSGEVSHIVLKSLKNDNLPAISIINAPPPKNNVARIDILPTMMSIKTDDKTCTSWISLSAQTRDLVVLPPLEVPRNVVVTYWDGGLLVHSRIEGHAQATINAVDKLAEQFSRQYRMDQPPDLSQQEQPKF